MKPDPRFLALPKSFWACVRLVGQECGYTERKTGQVLVPSRTTVEDRLERVHVFPKHLDTVLPDGTTVWKRLLDYFEYRAAILHERVEPSLMDAKTASREYRGLRKRLKPKCPLPMNKQRGSKKAPAYLTCMVNMLIEAGADGRGCDYDPRALTMVTRDGAPLRTFARRMDGAFPSVVNPVAVWEIKEYYHTTTFGSCVADGVYETLLDGMEIEDLAATEDANILHYLMIDAHYTWWVCGKSDLCRIVDMLHMGYVDEVLVGREILSRLPLLVKEWIQQMA